MPSKTLTDRQIRNTKPTDKKQTLSDGGGLALVVNPETRGGTKYFVYNFRFNGKQQTLRLGKYPDIGLAEAREKHQLARNDVVNGINPAFAKQREKEERKAAALNTFEHLSRQWHTTNLRRWKENHAARVLRYLEAEVFPAIGAMPIQEIRVTHIKALLDGIMTRGVHNTAEKIREWTAAVFDYAAMLEITEANPARILRQYIPPKPATNRPALPREELTEFYRRLILADVEHSNRIGLLLIMLVFVRNTELRGGKWAEIDFQAATWTIPAERMKHEKTAPKPPHVIPLADWPLELLAELREITGHTPYLFPSRTKAEGFISENTLGKIMNGMGYKGRATPHGFRALASSILNEQGFNPDAIERQLAHVEEDRIRAAYNRADYMDERREMMQWYSDYLRERYEAARADLADKAV
jgi:site-specific recombinase, phage integrase family